MDLKLGNILGMMQSWHQPEIWTIFQVIFWNVSEDKIELKLGNILCWM